MQLATTERTVEAFVLGPRGRYTMTPHQQATYLAIVALMADNRPSPTLAEIAAHIGEPGLSKNKFHRDVRALEERGWISIIKNKEGNSPNRNIRLREPVLAHLKPVHEGTIKR